MGMGVSGGGGGGGRRRRGRKKAIMSEINITPMVDVMLVLLIIFMVAAPMMTTGVPVDLPTSSAGAMPNQANPITIVVDTEGSVFIDKTPVAEADLIGQLTSMGVDGAVDRILVNGDTSANYGAVIRVIGLLSSNGYGKIGLVSQPEQ